MQGFGFFNQISVWFSILRKRSSVGITVEKGCGGCENLSVLPTLFPLAMSLPFIQLNWKLCGEVPITHLCPSKKRKKSVLFKLDK